MYKKKILFIVLVAIAIFLVGCQSNKDNNEEVVPVDMTIEEILSDSELQYPATNELFYYEIHTNQNDPSIGYVAITKYIGDGVFVKDEDKYASPKHIEIPDTIDGLPVFVIGNAAFQNASIETIKISKNVVSIGSSAFEECLDLTKVTFVDVKKDIEGREEGKGVITIGDNAFFGCLKLSDIKLPETLKTIGPLAFSECESLETINLPDELESLGYSAFASCISLKSITIPKYITAIDKQICYGCTALENIYLDDSVQTIEETAFQAVSPRAKIYGSPYSIAAHYAADNFLLFAITKVPNNNSEAQTDTAAK